MNQVHKPLLRLIRCALSIHPRDSDGILGPNNSHLLDLLIKLLIGDQVGSLGITEIGLFLELAVGELAHRSLGDILLKPVLLYSLILI